MIWVTGFDAVRIWHEYECGRDGALELLLKYNREDVANLETIIELRASRVCLRCVFGYGGAGLGDVTRPSKRTEQLLKETAELGKFDCLSA